MQADSIDTATITSHFPEVLPIVGPDGYISSDVARLETMNIEYGVGYMPATLEDPADFARTMAVNIYVYVCPDGSIFDAVTEHTYLNEGIASLVIAEEFEESATADH